MNVCVFCGSSFGTNPSYGNAARELARVLCQFKCTLIYGGGNVGLMGVLADEMLRNDARVVGIIPDFLVQREVSHHGLSELKVVSGMHERKKCMAELADVFIAMAGGMGTIDELAEILTWKQLGLIESPVGLLNTDHYFDHLILQLHKMQDEGFITRKSLDGIKIAAYPEELITLLGVNAVKGNSI